MEKNDIQLIIMLSSAFATGLIIGVLIGAVRY